MIKIHAHIAHAGAFAYMKQQAPNAVIAVMREDVAAMESGDRNDFKYADDFVYPGVKVDRVSRDGDTLKMGAVLLTAYHTPGHTRGATTWVLERGQTAHTGLAVRDGGTSSRACPRRWDGHAVSCRRDEPARRTSRIDDRLGFEPGNRR
jgi:glyoxylase-like metal-dependent hydrolase (beta-lactamase superfamily II)